jgi:hypothetical protein
MRRLELAGAHERLASHLTLLGTLKGMSGGRTTAFGSTPNITSASIVHAR